jgi:hypothetical protein
LSRCPGADGSIPGGFNIPPGIGGQPSQIMSHIFSHGPIACVLLLQMIRGDCPPMLGGLIGV